jgi:hypothetical protein
MGGACSTHGKVDNAYTILVGKSEAKKPLVRARRRWEDNIKIVIKEISVKDDRLIILAQNRDR